MFARLFAESGLSLDRLKALLEVSAAGSIVKAADGDPVRQSQYSRQIKELEDFFRIKLMERHGKGTRLTSSGKELARISRFFMLGLSNFQRGCLAEEQTFRICASPTFIQQFLLPTLSSPPISQGCERYITEIAGDDEIERRLHELTLDFGVIGRATISRPLQVKELGRWKLKLWVPQARYQSERKTVQALEKGELPLVLAARELDVSNLPILKDYEPRLVCDSFLEALKVMEAGELATVLPGFIRPDQSVSRFFHVPVPTIDAHTYRFRLTWNPRLLRLNPHTVRRRDLLVESLAKQISQ
jgi:DNA-binding transcriptional LysR family regulator